MLLPQFLLESGLAWSCMNLLWVTIGFFHFWGQSPCYVQKMAFYISLPHPLDLTHVLHISSPVFLWLTEEGLDTGVLFGAEQSNLLWSAFWLVMYPFIRKKFLCLKLKQLRAWHKYLSGHCTAWPVIKIQRVEAMPPRAGTLTKTMIHKWKLEGGYFIAYLYEIIKN